MDRWRNRFWVLVAVVVGVPLAFAVYAIVRFVPDYAVTYRSMDEQFKYGSTGGERASGFPYWVWKAMPVVFKDYLPKNGLPGYESFGMVYELDANGKKMDLPVGVMHRRNLGIDRVFVNCAVCHHSTVRFSPDEKPQLVLGMPAARFNLGAFEFFLVNIAADERFSSNVIIPEIERQAGGLGPIDKYVVYPLAISIMQSRLLMLRDRFLPMHPETWGPGRVDTFNSAKALFNFPFHAMQEKEKIGVADFPSIWNQSQRQGMQLHWDGNNCRVEERNKSAAFGTGTTPATIDLGEIDRVERWLNTLPPPLSWPRNRVGWFDPAKAARGKPVYEKYCADCHGRSGTDFTSNCMSEAQRQAAIRACEMQAMDVPYGPCVGKVTRLDQVGTDPYRLDSYTYDLASNQGLLYANVLYNDGAAVQTSYSGGGARGHSERFIHFRKTFGYANMPLDGIWLRAPYLHNGSVPTLRDLLNPPDQRPKQFYRGYDVIDPVNVGFIANVKTSDDSLFYTHDPKTGQPIPGNDNAGHIWGTTLPPDDKDAIVEYLKTF
jgi:hypothetical protein